MTSSHKTTTMATWTALMRNPRLTSRSLIAQTLSTTTSNNAASSSSVVAPSTTITTNSPYHDDIRALWEQASGDAELRVLKDQVSKTSLEFDEAVRAVSQQRRLVETWQKQHEESYQRHASLLMRREQWTPEEASMFVQITSQEVKARQALHDARQELHTLEEKANGLQQMYMDALRRKYQEEQAWQDRWRVLGTLGTWSLIGLNSIVFLVSQLLFYRREARRLIDIENLIKNHLTANNNNNNNTLKIATKEPVVKEVKAQDLEDTTKVVHDDTHQSGVDTAIVTAEGDSHGMDNDHPWRTKLKQFQQELADNLHVPSATAGAVASATVCVILGIVFSRR